jgi:hypothetical protein
MIGLAERRRTSPLPANVLLIVVDSAALRTQ